MQVAADLCGVCSLIYSTLFSAVYSAFRDVCYTNARGIDTPATIGLVARLLYARKMEIRLASGERASCCRSTRVFATLTGCTVVITIVDKL